MRYGDVARLWLHVARIRREAGDTEGWKRARLAAKNSTAIRYLNRRSAHAVTIHWVPRKEDGPQCGYRAPGSLLDTATQNINCGNCRHTRAYRRAIGLYVPGRDRRKINGR